MGQTSEYIPVILAIVLCLIGGIFDFMTYKNYKDASNRESFNCPVYSCVIPDSKCGTAPFRCTAHDTNSSGCSGDNKVCMVYDITNNLTYNSTPTS